MQEENFGKAGGTDLKAYQEAFVFKVREVEFFAERILAHKREIEMPFLDQVYSDSLHERIRERVEPQCEEAAYYYDALLSATFSALDCFARAHSFIEERTRKKNRRLFSDKDISFNLWVKRLRRHLSDLIPIRGDAPRTSDLEAILELDEKKFSKLRKMRNFYTHERHPVQDCDSNAISTVDGRVSGVSLPLMWPGSGPVDFIDSSSKETQEDLQLLIVYAGRSRQWFVVFSGVV
jgi:hypothetical protein